MNVSYSEQCADDFEQLTADARALFFELEQELIDATVPFQAKDYNEVDGVNQFYVERQHIVVVFQYEELEDGTIGVYITAIRSIPEFPTEED